VKRDENDEIKNTKSDRKRKMNKEDWKRINIKRRMGKCKR
jgi:hypothetical protein